MTRPGALFAVESGDEVLALVDRLGEVFELGILKPVQALTTGSRISDPKRRPLGRPSNRIGSDNIRVSIEKNYQTLRRLLEDFYRILYKVYKLYRV